MTSGRSRRMTVLELALADVGHRHRHAARPVIPRVDVDADDVVVLGAVEQLARHQLALAAGDAGDQNLAHADCTS
jgi:hypothetical protein